MSGWNHFLVSLAATQVGVCESGGNNLGAEVENYQSATWLKPGPWPWCAAFTAWVLMRALDVEAFRAGMGMSAVAAERWRCKDASAFGWEKWARQKGLSILPESALAKAGDFVVFDFSHIGIVEADQGLHDRSIRTIEGNTNGRGERDSAAGDGVWRKVRPVALTKSYLRIFP